MRKKILIPIGLIILVLAVTAYMNQTMLKMGMDYIKYRYFSQERVAENFSEIRENPFEKYLDHEEDSAEEIETPESLPTEPSTTASPDPVDNQNTPSPTITQPSESTTSQPTLSQISRQYMVEFEGMESRFRSDLEGLIGEAVEEYNKGQYSKSKLADIYLEKGEGMEAESDEKFYRLLANLEQKLVQNSFETNMVDEVESYYIKLKEYEKNRIIDKGMALLKN